LTIVGLPAGEQSLQPGLAPSLGAATEQEENGTKKNN